MAPDLMPHRSANDSRASGRLRAAKARVSGGALANPLSRVDIAISLMLMFGAAFAFLVWQRWDHTWSIGDDQALYWYAECIHESTASIFDLSPNACEGIWPYPPLIPTLAALVFLVTGHSGPHEAVRSLAPWYGLLAAALFIGARAEAGRATALDVATVGLAGWWITGLSGNFYTELPVSACLAAMLAAVVHSDFLKKPQPSALVGLFFGLGMLVKWSFAFFALAPFVTVGAVAAWRAFRNPMVAALAGMVVLGGVAWLARDAFAGAPLAGSGQVVLLEVWLGIGALSWWRSRDLFGAGEKTSAASLWLTIGIAGGVTLPWYLGSAEILAEFLARNASGDFFYGDKLPLSVTWIFYPATFVTSWGWIAAAGLAAGLASQVYARKPSFALWCTLAAIAGGVALALAPYRTERYIFPAFPLLAVPLVSAFGDNIRGTIWRAAMVAVAAWVQFGWLLGCPLEGERPSWPAPVRLHSNGNAAEHFVKTRKRLASLSSIFPLQPQLPDVFGDGIPRAARQLASLGEANEWIVAYCVEQSGSVCSSLAVALRDFETTRPAFFARSPSMLSTEAQVEEAMAEFLEGRHHPLPKNLVILVEDDGGRPDTQLQASVLENLGFSRLPASLGTGGASKGVALWVPNRPGPTWVPSATRQWSRWGTEVVPSAGRAPKNPIKR